MKLRFWKKDTNDKNSMKNLAQDFNEKIKVQNDSEKLSKEQVEQIEKKRKSILGNDFKYEFITKKELNEAIEKHITVQKTQGNNPFKTREDCFVTFFDDKWQERFRLPFEEINYGDKKLILNKTFEDGQLKINYLFYLPETSVDIKNAVVNQNANIKNLDRINSWINYVQAERTKGNDMYKLWDLKNDILAKIELEKKIETVKYGEHSFYETEISGKKSYAVQKINNNYTWLKVTSKGYFTVEPASKATVQKNILDKVDNVLNMRFKRNNFQIFMALGIFIGVIVGLIALYQFMTFDEQLLDKRVEEAIALRLEAYENEIDYLRKEIRRYNANFESNPNTNDSVPDFNIPQ